MINGKSVLGLIPARSGSKGIKDKNIKDFMGLPLIAHTINLSKEIRYIDELIVSTNDKKIKEISEQYGASVPFKRPKYLSDDKATNIDVALHAIEKIKTDLIIILQPTSPLRNEKDITNSIKLLFEPQVKMVVSAYKIKNYPYSFSLDKSDFISNFEKLKKLKTNRQSHKSFYTVNGAIYCSDTDYFVSKKSFFTSKTRVYLMPSHRSVDIDDLTDWRLAEKLYG